jgi:glutamate racemase
VNSQAPIGVFDSGLGGLTVARAIAEHLPHERLVYLGDTARVPYGTRSAQTVVRYARSCARALCQYQIKMLVVACNTVSAVALDMLRVELDMPVLGVIEPGAIAGVRATRSGRIGVIATSGTIASGAYKRAVASVSSRVEVFDEPAPLLVPLIEEGWLEGEVPAQVVRRYLSPFVRAEVDVLVLGCTHYPLLRPVIEAEIADLLGRPISVVDSAQPTAEALSHLLAAKGAVASKTQEGALHLLVTDLPGRFSEVATRLLGRSLAGVHVQQIDL